MIKGILRLIEEDRLDSNERHKGIIAKLIHILLALDLYKSKFETQFLQSSKAFYQGVANKDGFDSRNLAIYLSEVQGFLKAESARVYECLDISTHNVLLHAVQDTLIDEMADSILNHHEFEEFLLQERADDLFRVYHLFKLIQDRNSASDLIRKLRVRWKTFIYTKGEAMLYDEQLDKKKEGAIDDFI
mmetsp:Transcript_6153/g.9895  ORF Transcript_6153/g.9895 Transcript_6153/m.9895 type:complete len:188 (-) Transcript_6153:1529-2092(-)